MTGHAQPVRPQDQSQKSEPNLVRPPQPLKLKAKLQEGMPTESKRQSFYPFAAGAPEGPRRHAIYRPPGVRNGLDNRGPRTVPNCARVDKNCREASPASLIGPHGKPSDNEERVSALLELQSAPP